MDGTRARALLGVGQHATQEELRRAFRRRALATHPDHGGDSETFEATMQALRVLETAPSAPTAAGSQTATFDPNRRVDTYDCPQPARRTRAPRVAFADVLQSAVRQRTAFASSAA